MLSQQARFGLNRPFSTPFTSSKARPAATAARATHVKVACSLHDPWATLGISHNATEKEIKKAHRKLVLQHHPDVKSDDPLAHARFMRIQEAYELIMGKRQGKDIDNRPASQGGWDFHDWYWRFSMKRRKKGPMAAAMGADEPPPQPLRQQWQAQMAGLKQKAAAKRVQRRQQRGSAAAGPAGSAAAREGVWRSMTKNARKAEDQMPAAQREPAAAAQALGERPAEAAPTVAAAAASEARPSTPPSPPRAPSAGAAAEMQHDGGHAQLHAEAPGVGASQAAPPVEHHAAAAEEGSGAGIAAGGVSHRQRLQQLLHHAANLVRGAHSRGVERAGHAHVEHAAFGGGGGGIAHLHGRLTLQQLSALLSGGGHGRPQQHVGEQNGAVPADKHLHQQFQASLRHRGHSHGHRRQQHHTRDAAAGAAATAAAIGGISVAHTQQGGASGEAQAAAEAEVQVSAHHQPQPHAGGQYGGQYGGSASAHTHSRKFANRDEVQGRLSSQLAGLRRRAALKQEIESSC